MFLSYAKISLSILRKLIIFINLNILHFSAVSTARFKCFVVMKDEEN